MWRFFFSAILAGIALITKTIETFRNIKWSTFVLNGPAYARYESLLKSLP